MTLKCFQADIDVCNSSSVIFSLTLRLSLSYWRKLIDVTVHLTVEVIQPLCQSPEANSLLLRQYCPTNTAKTVPLPFLADSINEGTIAEFVKKEGQWVDLDETVANVETDKVTVEIKSPVAGLITKFHAAEGDNLDVGKPLFEVDQDAAKPDGTPAAKGEEKKPEPVKATEALTTKASEPKKEASKPSQSKPAPEPVASGERIETREPMSRLRARVAQRLKESQNTYALLTTFQEVDMFEAQATRKVLLD